MFCLLYAFSVLSMFLSAHVFKDCMLFTGTCSATLSIAFFWHAMTFYVLPTSLKVLCTFCLCSFGAWAVTYVLFLLRMRRILYFVLLLRMRRILYFVLLPRVRRILYFVLLLRMRRILYFVLPLRMRRILYFVLLLRVRRILSVLFLLRVRRILYDFVPSAYAPYPLRFCSFCVCAVSFMILFLLRMSPYLFCFAPASALERTAARVNRKNRLTPITYISFWKQRFRACKLSFVLTHGPETESFLFLQEKK
jgi:hypothetical protein